MTYPNDPRPTISAFLPCYNEAGNIIDTVRRLQDVFEKIAKEYEIIIVNDGSTDETASVVSKLTQSDPKIHLLSHPGNLGYGRAVASGISASRNDWVFFSDGDGQFDFEDLRLFIPYLSKFPLIIGYRRRRQEGFRRTLTSKAYNLMIRFLFGLRLKDIDCSFKLMDRSIFKQIAIKSSQFFVDTELMTKAFYLGLPIKELPVKHLARKAGHSTIRLGHILSTIREMRGQWQEIKSLHRRRA